MVRSLIDKATLRFCRLLDSLDELRWEAWDSTLRPNHTILQVEQDEHVPRNWKDTGQHTLRQALRVQVTDVQLTEEFRNARAEVDEVGNTKSQERRLSDWYYYKRDRLRRNDWAKYLSSNIDWDWDLAKSLRRLYKLDRRPASSAYPHWQPPVAGVISDGELVGVQGRTWNIKSAAADTELPTEVRIEYRTKAGEFHYVTFIPKSSEQCSSDVDVDLSVLDFVRQPNNCEPRVIPWTHYLSAEGYLITEDGSNE